MPTKKNGGDAVEIMSSVMASGAQGRISCSELMLFYWRKSLCAQTELVEDKKADVKKARGRISHLFEFENQASIYLKSPGV